MLLLRAVVGVTGILQGIAYLEGSENLTVGRFVASLISALAGAALLVGILTPVAAALTALGPIATALSWFPAPTGKDVDFTLPTVLVSVVAIALVLLGPGALSVDARLFGRREIIIPSVPRSPKP